MNPQKRQKILVCMMIGMLVTAAMWCFGGMQEKRDKAEFLAKELAQSHHLAEQIESIRTQPKLAAAEDIGAQKMGVTIETAMQKAGLNNKALTSVQPQSARRVGTSSYLKKPTVLSLKNVPLSRLAIFLYHLTDDTGMIVRSLRLTTPRSDKDSDSWDAEATVVYLIYSPTSKSRRTY